jgi:hypothetical protein
MRERRDKLIDRAFEYLGDAAARPETALGTEIDLLCDLPCTSLADARGYSAAGSFGEGGPLAKLLKWCLGRASLDLYEQVRGELSNVSF